MAEPAVVDTRTPETTGRDAGYWEGVAETWRATKPQALWRAHSDAVNAKLLAEWLPERVDLLLKTDLFDEAVGGGLHGLLASRARVVAGIDVSAGVVGAATIGHAGLRGVQADVRRLPFPDAAFDVVVSNSTLDHFTSADDLVAGLRELRRVLRPGGCLIVTLDNPANPIVALRARLPFGLLHRLGLVPYFVGVSCGPRELPRILTREGFEVVETTAVLHCPRVIAVAIARVLDRRAGPRGRERFLRSLMTWERLGRWPTRFRTGHFVAARAVRR